MTKAQALAAVRDGHGTAVAVAGAYGTTLAAASMALLRCAQQRLVDRFGTRPYTYALTSRGLQRLEWLQGTMSESGASGRAGPLSAAPRPAAPRSHPPLCPVCHAPTVQPAVRCTGCGMHAHVPEGTGHAAPRGRCGIFEVDSTARPLASRTWCRCGGCGRAAQVAPGTRCAACKHLFYAAQPG